MDDVSFPGRIAREQRSLRCLPASDKGPLGIGVERCATLHCIEKFDWTCVKMGISSSQSNLGREGKTHYCVDVNIAVGVDMCAEGPYCIDTENIPSRCMDLSS